MIAPTLSRSGAASVVWDVVILGAGPAGTWAALEAARAGLEVLIVERKSHPRYKVCGGCLNAPALTMLESAANLMKMPLPEMTCLRTFALHAGRRTLRVPYHGGASLSRAELDLWLTRVAIAAGAHYLPETTGFVGELEANTRAVHLHSPLGDHATLQAKAVVAADGLAHPSLARLKVFSDRVAAASHVGGGCELKSDWPFVERQTIHMAVGRQGYVGLVRCSPGRINVAAALSPGLVRQQRGLGGAILETLRQTGIQPPGDLTDAAWHGTPLLTRRTDPLAAPRLFLLGDAAGYVEPFTGEGIAWAWSSAQQLSPLLARAADQWTDDLIACWARVQQQLRIRQRTCGWLATGLRRPWLVNSAIRSGQAFPQVAAFLTECLTAGAVQPIAIVSE